MLPIFPTFLPEEPVYSAIARYGDMMRFNSAKAVSRAVFGAVIPVPVVDLPGRLELLLSRLLPGHGYTADGLIAHHTAFPYYRAFLHTERADAIAHAMRTGTARDAAVLLGLRRRPVAPVDDLRFCRDCIAEDRSAAHGTPYWRRVHQLPGVLVCPSHGAVLTESGVDRWGHRGAREYVSLASALAHGGGTQLHVPRAWRAAALNLAVDSQWLLRHGLAAGADLATAAGLHAQVGRWLQARGLAAGDANRARHPALARAARATFPAGLPTALGLDESAGGSAPPVRPSPDTGASARAAATRAARGGADPQGEIAWVAALLRTRRRAARDELQHPLLYLLLLGILEVTAERFFAGPPPRPGGADEMEVPTLRAPCGNPSCTAYDPPVPRPLPAEACGGAPRVVVDCPLCGFRYGQRREETDSRRRTVLETGPVWDARLTALVAAGTTSSARLVRELGLSLPWVQRHAYRLNVWHPNWTETAYARAKAGNEPEARRAAAREATRDRHRERWLALRAAHPEEGRTALHARDRATYFYLHSADKAWLRDHLPDVVSREPTALVIDWAARDAVALPRVRAAVTAIRARAGRPVRVTIKAVARALREANTFAVSLPHLDTTREFIDQVLEDGDAFARRVIVRAAAGAAAERRALNVAELRKRAALSPSRVHAHRTLFDDAIRAVNAHLDRGVPLPSEWERMLAPAPWEHPTPA